MIFGVADLYLRQVEVHHDFFQNVCVLYTYLLVLLNFFDD